MRKCMLWVLVISVYIETASADDARIRSWTGFGPVDVSRDGSVIVGRMVIDGVYKAAYWTKQTGFSLLSPMPSDVVDSQAVRVSEDGSEIFVMASGPSIGSEVLLWKASGFEVFVLPDGPPTLIANADFSVRAGTGGSPRAPYEAFRWTRDGGTEWLGALSEDLPFSSVENMTSDGSVIVGEAPLGTGESIVLSAFRWTRQTGMVALGNLPPNEDSKAYDVTRDGSIIVGVADHDSFFWDAVHGMRNLKDAMKDDYGIDMTGWGDLAVAAISSDGTTIVGDGVDPNGNYVSLAITIPEPATAILLLAALTARYRRRA